MSETNCSRMNRRGFLGGIVPGCAMTCMAFRNPSGLGCARSENDVQQTPHKFDMLRDPPLTLRQLEVIKINRFLQFSEYLSDELGRERVIEILKDFQSKRNISQARRAATRLGSNNFDAFKRFYNPEIPALARIVTLEIVEDTETVYQWKITECINTEPYLRANAADLGYAAACHGDYAFAESFNPSIRLVRDKTLMQGDSHCNHRYIYQPDY